MGAIASAPARLAARIASAYSTWFDRTAAEVYGTTGARTLTRRLREAGVEVVDGPRHTGGGYYEVVLLDPEDGFVEVVTRGYLGWVDPDEMERAA